MVVENSRDRQLPQMRFTDFHPGSYSFSFHTNIFLPPLLPTAFSHHLLHHHHLPPIPDRLENRQMTQLQQSHRVSRTHFLSPDWQSLLRTNVREPAELCTILRLPSSVVSLEAAAVQPLNVTRDYLNRIEPGNPSDPLLLQILPRQEELKSVLGFSDDPLDESSCIQRTLPASPCVMQQGCAKNKQSAHENMFAMPVLQKYSGRELILATDRCAAHCRFCFRRLFPKKKSQPFSLCKPDAKHALISADDSKNNDEFGGVREIILSGGDPLMLDDENVQGLLNYIKDLHPGNRVRLHTRMPVWLPERMTPQLIEVLRDYRFDPVGGAVYVVLHVNHLNELSEKVVNAITSMIDAGIPVLSQTVLLRNVNDRFETLFDLFEKLADIRVIPYYLHQLDHVQGAAHFEVPTAKGQVLVSKLSLTLPGYAVPRYVREIPGESKKARL